MASTETSSWLQQLFGGVDKLTDILNVGRLLFYTAAGALVIYPFDAVVRLAQEHKFCGQPLYELAQAFRGTWELVVASTIVGFMIAACGWVRVVDQLSVRVKQGIESQPIDEHAYPFRYPQFKNLKSEDYSAWLIAEYFRFIEIVVYIPLGFLAGLGLITLFSAFYMLSWAFAGKAHGLCVVHRDFVVSALLFILCTFYLWPKWWLPKVAEPIVGAYYRAKLLLAAGLDRSTENIPSPSDGKS